MVNECIFCTISNNLLENKNIFLKSEKCFAIPDLYPATKGHTLIVSKDHHKNLMLCPDEILEDAIKLVKKTAEKLLLTYPEIKGFNYKSNQEKVAQQVIFHLHIHVIPRY